MGYSSSRGLCEGLVGERRMTLADGPLLTYFQPLGSLGRASRGPRPLRAQVMTFQKKEDTAHRLNRQDIGLERCFWPYRSLPSFAALPATRTTYVDDCPNPELVGPRIACRCDRSPPRSEYAFLEVEHAACCLATGGQFVGYVRYYRAKRKQTNGVIVKKGFHWLWEY